MTPMKAIKAKCIDCIYDPKANGTLHAQIESCTSKDCSLYEYRPLTGATKKKLKQQRIEAMTDLERAAYNDRAEAARVRLLKAKNN